MGMLLIGDDGEWLEMAGMMDDDVVWLGVVVGEEV